MANQPSAHFPPLTRPVMAVKHTNDNSVTKWGYRLALLWLAYAVCQWLDKVKVRRVGIRALMTGEILISRP